MSKEISDVLDRLNGDLIALQGMRSKIPPTPAEGVTQPPVAPKMPQEDYAAIKKLVDEVAGLAKTLGETLDKEMKVPDTTATAATSSSQAGGAEAHSSKEAKK